MPSELLPVGLLTPIGSGLRVSEGAAGLMLTVPGLVAAVSAALVTVTAARIDRRTLLAALVALMAVANLVCAAASHYAVLLAARVAIGVSVGGFWAIAGGLAVRLVPARHVARATAIVFGGVSTASVVGVPAGTLIGDLGGWRAAFAAVGVLGLVALAGLLAFVPALPSQGAMGFRRLAELPRRAAGVRVGVLVTFLLITGHFTAYTFVRPILGEGANVEDALVGALLMAYGVAGVAGNFVAGSRAGARPRRTLLAICAALSAVMALFALAGTGRVAAFNLSIALGALLGGALVDATTTTGVLWAAGLLALLAATAVSASRRSLPA
ncbi:MFS transporter [Spirillospora sp. CA-253888]